MASRQSGRSSGRNGKRRAGKNNLTIIIAVAAAAIVLAVGIILIVKRVNTNKQNSLLNVDTFYSGVFVDDIDLGGLTKQSAKEKIEAAQLTRLEQIKLKVVYESKSWNFGYMDMNCAIDTDAVLDKAYQVGRSEDQSQRYEYVLNLPQNPVKLTTTLTVDATTLKEDADKVASEIYVAPKDAVLVNFDPTIREGEKFTIATEEAGLQADAEKLYADMKASVEGGTFADVKVSTSVVEPAIKAEDLKGTIVLIGSFTTKQSNDSNREHNIDLACKAVSGKVLMPGDTFSYNEATGERTRAKGYVDAGIINGGEPAEGLAGGVCQVSGTLYNAVLKAELEIVERTRHTFTSSYLSPGLDATVDYPKLDFKFKNNTTSPVYIFMTSDGDKEHTVTAEIYGAPQRTDGLVVECYNKVLSRKEPGPIEYRVDYELEPGKTRIVKAKTGITVGVYKKYVDASGKQVGDEVLLYKDTYPPIAERYYYAPGENPLEATPTPAPVTSVAPVTPTAAPTNP